MRALSKLINENEPDLVLFVGEALVGNDGVNQLQMFNQVLHADLAIITRGNRAWSPLARVVLMVREPGLDERRSMMSMRVTEF